MQERDLFGGAEEPREKPGASPAAAGEETLRAREGRRHGAAAHRDEAPPAPGEQAGAKLEEELGRLERIVQKLEREDVPLDEAMALFEEGIAIARSARGKLEAAEGRIREILRQAGETVRLRDLEP